MVDDGHMTARTPDVAERFVAAINAHDVNQLLALMTPDHRFVDSPAMC